MKLEKCKYCKTEANRIVIERKKVKKHGREFIEESQAYKEYSCECGKCRTFGDLTEKEIDKVHKFILDLGD